MSEKTEIVVSPRPEIAGRINLYKYVSVKALEGLLRYGDFRVCYRKDSNDPQEMTPAGYLPGEESTYSTRGFVSFTAKSDCAPMWGNYADKYAGACIEFQFTYFDPEHAALANDKERYVFMTLSKLAELGFEIKYIKAFLDENDGMLKTSISRQLLVKCKYQSDRKRVRFPEASRTEEEAERKGSEYWWGIMCTKDGDWAYEEEYRLPLSSLADVSRVDYTMPPMYFTNIATPYIKKIVLGPACPLTREDAKKMIYFSSKEREKYLIPDDVVVTKARFTRNSYALDDSGVMRPVFDVCWEND